MPTPTEYPAQILELPLSEQNDLKNESERCSADLVTLEFIGRSIGQQVRLTRNDSSNFVALFTVQEANPDADLGDPKQAAVVRTGQRGRERLGTDAEMATMVQAKVVDDGHQPGTFRFFEAPDDHPKQADFIAIARGGEIEPHTDEQAEEVVGEPLSPSPSPLQSHKDAGKRAAHLAFEAVKGKPVAERPRNEWLEQRKARQLEAIEADGASGLRDEGNSPGDYRLRSGLLPLHERRTSRALSRTRTASITSSTQPETSYAVAPAGLLILQQRKNYHAN